MRLTMLGRTAYFAQNSQSKNKMRIKIMNGGGWKTQEARPSRGGRASEIVFQVPEAGVEPALDVTLTGF
jgi:hypothetical protein